MTKALKVLIQNWRNGLKQTPLTSQYRISNELKTQRVPKPCTGPVQVYDLVYRPKETKYYETIKWSGISAALECVDVFRELYNTLKLSKNAAVLIKLSI